ncbi:MAG: hypothetical protein JSS81_30105 [Acidobacteria bacterium]|nr:hypothetical protein [Acidobacteriota bacterium]
MKRLILLLCLSTLWNAAASAQNSEPDLGELDALNSKIKGLDNSIRKLENRLMSLTQKLRAVSARDEADAKGVNADAERLYLCCPLEGEGDEVTFLSSGYTFRTPETGDGYYAAVLRYSEDGLGFDPEGSNHGFILDLGRIPLESVGEKTPAFAALAEYRPPVKPDEIKKQFTAGKFTFENSAPVKIGDTYLLRAVCYEADGNLDKIYALRVVRRDADGSIVIFVKEIRNFPPPKREPEFKYSLSDIAETGKLIKLREFLREQELPTIELEFVKHYLIVKGTASKEKSAALREFIQSLEILDLKYEVVEK